MVTDLHTQLDLVRDYVNTFDFETRIDTIATPDDLATWLSEQGLVDDLVEPTAEEVTDALAVREAIRELLLENNGVEADAAAASKTLEAAGRRARLGVRFEDGRAVLAPEDVGVQGAIGRIVATVAELASTDEWKRLKGCRDENCRVAFYDKSRMQRLDDRRTRQPLQHHYPEIEEPPVYLAVGDPPDEQQLRNTGWWDPVRLQGVRKLTPGYDWEAWFPPDSSSVLRAIEVARTEEFGSAIPQMRQPGGREVKDIPEREREERPEPGGAGA